jgi:endonuclease/exonuclease/phosphatase family metal-dependent hydrolase
VRLATFNILNGRSPADDRVDVDRFADAVRSLRADVLALQEVDRNQPRSDHTDLTAVAAEAMGADEHRFVAALAGSPGATWIAADGEEQPDAAAYGIALLSRYPVLGWEVVRQTPVPVRVPMLFKGSRRPEWVRDEPRVAVAATVEAPGGVVTVVNTHLSFIDWWNGRQLRRLVSALAGATHPLVLAGDLNMGPDRARKITGMQSLANGPTFPADSPREQIDHILGRGPIRATSSEVVPLKLSDHRALVADLA